jgi:formamidopyrimidine-DNA glycosylase
MPELPEVEINARNLRRWLGRKSFTGVTLPPSRVLRPAASAEEVRARLEGRRVQGVDRRGKWIRLRLDSGDALYSHLGMTGKWVERPTTGAPLPHERACLTVAERAVCYTDPRLFGRLQLKGRGERLPEWEALGPDPLTDGLDAALIKARLAGKRRSIKEVLLDQSLFAGVGNVQGTEALFFARIDPRRSAASLTSAEVERLVEAVGQTIARTLEKESGPKLVYVEEAGAPNPFLVYGREGEPCPRCATRLERIVQGGRATVFCPRCQAAHRRPR